MKQVFVLALLLISLNDIFCLIAPKKDKKIGAVVGRAYIHLNKKREILKEGNYYNITLSIENKITKKNFTIVTDNNGYFYSSSSASALSFNFFVDFLFLIKCSLPMKFAFTFPYLPLTVFFSASIN